LIGPVVDGIRLPGDKESEVFRGATHVWRSCGVLAAALVMASPAAAQTPARSPHPCLIWTTCTPQIGPWVVSTGRGHDGYTFGCPDDPKRPGVPQRAVGSDVVFAAEGEPPGASFWPAT
jgi:hypothetical protein